MGLPKIPCCTMVLYQVTKKHSSTTVLEHDLYDSTEILPYSFNIGLLLQGTLKNTVHYHRTQKTWLYHNSLHSLKCFKEYHCITLVHVQTMALFLSESNVFLVLHKPFCDAVTPPNNSLNSDVSLYIRLVSCCQLYCF